MKNSIAKMKAIEISNERREPIRIAKANKKEDYCLFFKGYKPAWTNKYFKTK